MFNAEREVLHGAIRGVQRIKDQFMTTTRRSRRASSAQSQMSAIRPVACHSRHSPTGTTSPPPFLQPRTSDTPLARHPPRRRPREAHCRLPPPAFRAGPPAARRLPHTRIGSCPQGSLFVPYRMQRPETAAMILAAGRREWLARTPCEACCHGGIMSPARPLAASSAASVTGRVGAVPP